MLENEDRIVEKAKTDKVAFGLLYDHYWPKIVRYLKAKLNGNELLAEDIASTTFEKAFKNIKLFKWQGVSFSAWIYKIAYNSYVDYVRTIKTPVNVDIENVIADNRISVEEKMMEDETALTLEKLISTLNEREQKIIKLKFYEGYTNRKIAEIMGMTETNVGTVINRAINKLRGS